MMRRWKWLVILSAILAIGVITAAFFLPRPGFSFRSLPHRDAQEFQNYPLSPFFEKNTFIISTIGIFFSLALGGILILFLFPTRVRAMSTQVPRSISPLLRLTALGLISTILVIAAAFFSVLAIGTFPLAIILFVGIFTAGLFGLVVCSYVFGKALVRRAGWHRLSPVVSFLLGWLVLFAPTRIPLVGGLLFLLYIWLGLGLAVDTKLGSMEPWNLNSLMEADKHE